MMFWIEGLTALAITIAFLISSFFLFKPHQIAHGPAKVHIGAGIQGATIGLLIGFVMLPLRLSLFAPEGFNPPSAGSTSLSFLPAFLFLVLVRRGVLLRAPFISRYLRAYRRAGLLKTVDEAQKNLAKLDVIEGRRAAA
ncbi:MAG: hypothetical protein ABW199_00585 [Caulobacterales bacterium]